LYNLANRYIYGRNDFIRIYYFGIHDSRFSLFSKKYVSFMEKKIAVNKKAAIKAAFKFIKGNNAFA